MRPVLCGLADSMSGMQPSHSNSQPAAGHWLHPRRAGVWPHLGHVYSEGRQMNQKLMNTKSSIFGQAALFGSILLAHAVMAQFTPGARTVGDPYLPTIGN